MVYLMTPGAGELTENLVHLVKSGHTAHALPDADHHPTGSEHGCSGPYHVCSCHTSTAFMIAQATVDVASPLLDRVLTGWWTEDRPTDGYLSSIFRPPIA